MRVQLRSVFRVEGGIKAEDSMLKSIFVAFGFVVLSAFAATSASADSTTQTTVASDGSYQVAQSWGNRVCCKRGGRDWWSTRRDCRRSGGHVTYNRECRDDRFDRVRNDRVCCERGRSEWWSTTRACRRAGGHVTYNRECRR
jgi:hypothetical protein